MASRKANAVVCCLSVVPVCLSGQCISLTTHSADVTGITNITAGNLIVWTFMYNENEANSRIIFTKWLREGLLNSLHCTN